MKDSAETIKNLTPPARSEAEAYHLGYDCGLNGASITNSHFSIFSSPENMKEWERGKRDGEAKRREAVAGQQDSMKPAR